MAIERIVERSETSDLFALATQILSLPRPIHNVEAIAVFPGLGEYLRVTQAIECYQNGPARFLLVAGMDPEELTFEELNVKRLRMAPYNLTARTGIKTQVRASNTKVQAEWVCDLVEKHKLVSLALFVSPYHIVRAYLTLVASLLGRGLSDVFVFPAPVLVGPSVVIPATSGNSWEMTPGEVARIRDYQAKGDVATLDRAWLYLERLWAKAEFLGRLGALY